MTLYNSNGVFCGRVYNAIDLMLLRQPGTKIARLNGDGKLHFLPSPFAKESVVPEMPKGKPAGLTPLQSFAILDERDRRHKVVIPAREDRTKKSKGVSFRLRKVTRVRRIVKYIPRPYDGYVRRPHVDLYLDCSHVVTREHRVGNQYKKARCYECGGES